MCTLVIYREQFEKWPLVVAANRDEFYSRAARPPCRLPELPTVVAGRDLEASGTWLGCRVDGGFLVAGLLNRRSPDATTPAPAGERSRGLVCLDALREGSVEQVMARVDASEASRYGPFNLLVADAQRALVIDNGDGLRTTELATGMSVLTNLDVNDPRCPRLASAVAGFEAVGTQVADSPSIEALLESLGAVLGNHENSLDPLDRNPLSRLCIHSSGYGTRSSSVIVLERGGGVRYYHADGPPCCTALGEVRF